MERVDARRPAVRWWEWWRWGVGISLLSILVGFVGVEDLIRALGRASPLWLVIAVALSLAWLFLGAYNVWILLRRLAPVSLSEYTEVYVTSWATALLLPGQLGDAAQVVLLRRHGVPQAASGAAYLSDKVISVTWLLLVAAYGVGRYAPRQGAVWGLALLVGVVVLGGIAAVLLFRFPAGSDGLMLRVKLSAERLREHLAIFVRAPSMLMRNFVQTVLKWILMAFIYLATFRAFGSSIDLDAAATIPVMSSFVGYIPISPGGAGTVEWTAVLLFAQTGVDEATVLSVYLFLRVLLLALTLLALLAFSRRLDSAGYC